MRNDNGSGAGEVLTLPCVHAMLRCHIDLLQCASFCKWKRKRDPSTPRAAKEILKEDIKHSLCHMSSWNISSCNSCARDTLRVQLIAWPVPWPPPPPLPSFPQPRYCCEWDRPGGDRSPTWTPGNNPGLLTWPGWPATAGAGNPPGRGSACRAAGCSSWTRRPSGCRGSRWCSPPPPTAGGNDREPHSLSMRRRLANRTQAARRVGHSATFCRFDDISILNTGYLPSHSVLCGFRAYLTSTCHCRERDGGFFCNIPSRWAKGFPVRGRKEQAWRMYEAVF